VCRPQRRSRQAHGNNHAGGAGAAAAAGPSTTPGQAAHSPDDVLVHQLMLLLTSAHRGFTSHEAVTQLAGNVVAAAVRAANQANAERDPAGSQPSVPRQPASYSPSDPIPSPPRFVPLPELDFFVLELLGVTAAQAPNTLRPPSDVSGAQGSHTASVLPSGAAAPVGPVPSLGRGRGEGSGRGRGRGSHSVPSQMGVPTAAATNQPLDLSLAAFPPLGHQPSRGAAWSTRPIPQGSSAQRQAIQLNSEAFPDLAAADAAQPAASRRRRYVATDSHVHPALILMSQTHNHAAAYTADAMFFISQGQEIVVWVLGKESLRPALLMHT